MSARPHDAAFVKDDDPIGVPDGGETLGDDDDRRVPEGFAESTPHRGIGFAVKGGEAVVEQVGARIRRDRAGDGETLALAARHVRAALAHG